MSKITRRRVLTNTGAAGLAIAAGFVAFQPATEVAAAPDPFKQFRSSEIKKFEIGGRSIKVGENSKDLVVTIDGRKLASVDIQKDGNRRYLTMMYPFSEFSDLRSLVVALIEGDGTLFIL